MKKRLVIALVLAIVLTLVIVVAASAVSGAAFTTFNPWVDGLFKSVCKNSIINCNIYGIKQDVWLNGGPTANGLGPDGQYFFAVLVPGGQPNPNDGGAKNLSDDFDAYTNRTFTVVDGEVYYYGGTHALDSGNFLDADRPYCTNKRGCTPDGLPPLIRLYPYADTWNPGGVYILAICSLERGYPVEPRDCKYDAFKVKEGVITLEFMLGGIKFEDLDADGAAWVDEPKLSGWTITITGTGFLGEPINASTLTGEDGAWNYGVKYSNIPASTPVYTAHLTVCEVVQPGWTQSFPDPACYTIDIAPAAAAAVYNLDFGNWQPVEVTACKDEDLDGSLTSAGDRAAIAGWPVALSIDGYVVDWQKTGENGCYTWTDLTPGIIYDVHEGLWEDWYALTPTEWTFDEAESGDKLSYTFVNTEYVEVTACKVEDMDGLTDTDIDRFVIPAWPVSLTKEGTVIDSQHTGEDGCYTWTGLEAGYAYDVHEDMLPGWYAIEPVDHVFAKAISGDSFSHVFLNTQPVSIEVFKFFDLNEDQLHQETEGMLSGFEFCLYDAADNLVSTDDFFTAPELACKVTGAVGMVGWAGLKPGTYTVVETPKEGWFPTGPMFGETSLLSGGSDEFWFGNVTNCVGLTPGYWSNWRNHYTAEQFLILLEGTIAQDDISLADYYLMSIGCDNDDALHCMQRFLLANQLTLNLTQHPDLPNPSGGSMFYACQVPGYDGTMGYWLGEALEIHAAGGVGFDHDIVIWVKTMLDYFANLMLIYWP